VKRVFHIYHVDEKFFFAHVRASETAWEANIEVDLIVLGCENGRWMELIRNMYSGRLINSVDLWFYDRGVNMIMMELFPYNTGYI
jgi:hypothetical protein